jgi:alkylated DNA repair protein (DNA oxidative demethylase)
MTENNIEGLKVLYNFISKQEEEELLSHIDIQPMSVKRGGRSSIKRWGSGGCYNNFVVSETIPEWLTAIAQKIIDAGLLQKMPDQISLSLFEKGDYVPPHIDNPQSGKVITTLSLLSEAQMIFTKDGEKLDIPLPKRTLVQMWGELRNEWKHEIAPVNEKRYSLVFRHSKN